MDAAQEAKSAAIAEAAEKAMVEESTRAGSAAYQFNPDATPAEKDAQVKSVGFLLPCPQCQRGLLLELTWSDDPHQPPSREKAQSCWRGYRHC